MCLSLDKYQKFYSSKSSPCLYEMKKTLALLHGDISLSVDVDH